MRITINTRIFIVYFRTDPGRNFRKKKIRLFPLILFCFGFSTVFILLGASASFLGQLFLKNSEILRIMAGAIIIIFSLQLVGFINIPLLNLDKRFEARKSSNILFPYIIGLAFGFGWTPCIGPILGSILALAAIEETLWKALILLSLYSLGLAIPFIFAGYLTQKFLIISKNFRRNINIFSKIGGIILLITGILILTNQLQSIGFYLFNVFPFLANFG